MLPSRIGRVRNDGLIQKINFFGNESCRPKSCGDATFF